MDYIDKTVYINLERRTDRRELIEKEFQRFGLTNVERFPAIDIPHHGLLGCGKSHLAVLKKAKASGWNNVLIFEDDFTFLVEPEEFHKQLQKLFDNHIKFDVCFLSYYLYSFESLLETSDFLRVLFSGTASGYLVSSHYYDTLISLYQEALPKLESTGQHWLYANDIVWKDLQQKDHWICFAKRLGKQRDGYSDNRKQYESYDC